VEASDTDAIGSRWLDGRLASVSLGSAMGSEVGAGLGLGGGLQWERR